MNCDGDKSCGTLADTHVEVELEERVGDLENLLQGLEGKRRADGLGEEDEVADSVVLFLESSGAEVVQARSVRR